MRKLQLLFIGFLFIQSLSALQWPVTDPVIVETFGSPLMDQVQVGLVLDGIDSQVSAYSEGELIFMAQEGYGSAGGDGVIVLQHDDGFRSCYGAMVPDTNVENRSYLKEGDLLGIKKSQLLFAIRDGQLNRWVNPLFMFTSMFDDQNPRVEGVFLEQNEIRLELDDNSVVTAGDYRLLLKVSDKVEKGGGALLPHQIKVRYLGRVVFSLSFDSIVSREGHIYFEGTDKESCHSLFSYDGLIDVGPIAINRGKGFLEVELTDYRGNRSTRHISLNRDS